MIVRIVRMIRHSLVEGGRVGSDREREGEVREAGRRMIATVTSLICNEETESLARVVSHVRRVREQVNRRVLQRYSSESETENNKMRNKGKHNSHSITASSKYLESEPQFLTSEAGRFPDKFRRIDPPPRFGSDSFVLFENGGGDDEVMLTFVKLQ